MASIGVLELDDVEKNDRIPDYVPDRLPEHVPDIFADPFAIGNRFFSRPVLSRQLLRFPASRAIPIQR